MSQTSRPTSLAGSSDRRPLDREAFASHYIEAYPRLVLVGYGLLGDRHLAEDAVQEAASIAMNKLDQFTPGTHTNPE